MVVRHTNRAHHVSYGVLWIHLVSRTRTPVVAQYLYPWSLIYSSQVLTMESSEKIIYVSYFTFLLSQPLTYFIHKDRRCHLITTSGRLYVEWSIMERCFFRKYCSFKPYNILTNCPQANQPCLNRPFLLVSSFSFISKFTF